jgi:hypothetical protein
MPWKYDERLYAPGNRDSCDAAMVTGMKRQA